MRALIAEEGTSLSQLSSQERSEARSRTRSKESTESSASLHPSILLDEEATTATGITCVSSRCGFAGLAFESVGFEDVDVDAAGAAGAAAGAGVEGAAGFLDAAAAPPKNDVMLCCLDAGLSSLTALGADAADEAAVEALREGSRANSSRYTVKRRRTPLFEVT